MKTKQICIGSALCKHLSVLFKLVMQVSIGSDIIKNENRVTGKSQKLFFEKMLV